MSDFELDLAQAVGIIPEDNEKQAALTAGARKALLATGLTGVALGSGAGAVAGQKIEKRKRFSAARVNTAKGPFHVVGERRYIKDLAEAIRDKDVGKLQAATDRLLTIPSKQAERVAPKLSPGQLSEGAKEVVEEKQEGDISGAQAKALLKGIREKAEKTAGLTSKEIAALIAGTGFTAGGLGLAAGKKIEETAARRRMSAHSKLFGKAVETSRSTGKRVSVPELGMTVGTKKAGLTPKQIAALTAGAGALGLGGGAAAVGGLLRGRDFAVVDTPMGAVAGRKADLKGMTSAAQKGDQQAFLGHLKRTVPVHPLVSQVLRAQVQKKTSALTAGSPLTQAELEKFGGPLSTLLSKGKGLLSKLFARAPKAVGGKVDPRALAGLKGKAPGRATQGWGRMPRPGAAPKPAPAAAAAAGKKKGILPWWAPVAAGGAGVTWLAGKGIGEAGKTMRAGMMYPQGGGYMARQRFQ